MMWEIKVLFDFDGIFNFGVVFFDDFELYFKDFKCVLMVEYEVDCCVECGYCELICLSKSIMFMF